MRIYSDGILPHICQEYVDRLPTNSGLEYQPLDIEWTFPLKLADQHSGAGYDPTRLGPIVVHRTDSILHVLQVCPCQTFEVWILLKDFLRNPDSGFVPSPSGKKYGD